MEANNLISFLIPVRYKFSRDNIRLNFACSFNFLINMLVENKALYLVIGDWFYFLAIPIESLISVENLTPKIFHWIIQKS